ncbi:MAG: hypothetical protein JWP08_4531 [Bryobacterales bacterium]|nr:hypothetical protein [Bryobacterales bacterium]
MPSFCVLFPAFCDGLREPDPSFNRELSALETLGIPWRVVNLDALRGGDLVKAFRFFGDAPSQPIIYRGWILHPEEFSNLVDALASRGCRTITTAENYRQALLFPEFYPAIADCSFPAVWIEGSDPVHALQAAQQLGPPPYFIKDHAKSAKEIWPHGCVVLDKKAMAPTIRALQDFREDQFEGGIVIRPLMRRRYIGESPFGGELFEEYRLFFFLGSLISLSAYDRIGGSGSSVPDCRFLSQRIDSPFFSADVVVCEDGRHYILEIGDGGSSALPPTLSPMEFYSAMERTLSQAGAA